MPELAQRCIESWHKHMPDYEYRLWNEENFDINSNQYVKEAYDARKFAFVSDYVRLHALKEDGGIYLDVDFEVYKPFDDLLYLKAFAGFEGSKHNPVMMGLIASEPNGEWVTEMLDHYQNRHFCIDGKMDLTTNVQFVSTLMQRNGFVPNGKEQDYRDLHIFPVEYFSPRLTTGEYHRTNNTYCEHKGVISSWARRSLKSRLLGCFSQKILTRMILLKRKMIG